MSSILLAATNVFGGDPYWDNVALLLDGDGTNGQTTFTDLSSSPHTITRTGDTKVSTSGPKHGTGSIRFDGNGDRLSLSSSSTLPINSSGAYTIECWAKFDEALPVNRTILNYGSANTGQAFGFRTNNAGALVHYWWGNDLQTGDLRQAAHGSINFTDWNHFVAQWDGTNRRTFVNGVQRASDTPGAWGLTNRSNGTIGARILFGPTEYMYGYIDDFRITAGVARYPSSGFTPPTSAFPTR